MLWASFGSGLVFLTIYVKAVHLSSQTYPFSDGFAIGLTIEISQDLGITLVMVGVVGTVVAEVKVLIHA